MPKRGVVRFDKREKLAPKYIGPFEVLERVGIVAYRLVLPPSLLGVHEVFHFSMLRKYTPDPIHVVCILDSRDQVLQRKTVRLVKVLRQHRGVEEAIWEREDTMRATYPFLFEDEGVLV